MYGVLTVSIPGREPESRRLPPGEFLAGRGMGWGFRHDDTWCSRSLVDLESSQRGWIAYNHHDGLTVQGPQVIDARYNKGAFVLLTRGSWTLTWNTRMSLTVLMTPALTAEQAALPEATQVSDLERLRRTDLLVLKLSDVDKHRLAVLFRHLIEGTPAPPNLARAAAADLDMAEPVLRAYANTMRRRASEALHVRLDTVDELGEHLVRVTGLVTRAHLKPR